MSWHKLIERNDWESVTVHIGGPVVGGRFKTNLELKACKPALKAGEYKVRWPDGKEESLRVKMNSYTTSCRRHRVCRICNNERQRVDRAHIVEGSATNDNR